MTIRHLRIFLCVIDEGGISRAAQKLYISQPSVSQTIAEMEDYYGVRLFDRISKRLFITGSGKLIESYARHILSLFDEMERRAKDSEMSGVIRVGASLTVGSTILPQILLRFKARAAGQHTQINVKNTQDLEEMLLKNALDIAIVEGSIHSADLTCRPFIEDEVILVCGRTHPLYQKRDLAIQDIAGSGFILREKGSGTRELFESVMAARDIPWQTTWEVTGSGGIISAAVGGFGIGVISRRLVTRELSGGELWELTIGELRFKRKFSVVYHKNKYLSPPMNLLINICNGADEF